MYATNKLLQKYRIVSCVFLPCFMMGFGVAACVHTRIMLQYTTNDNINGHVA